MRPYMIGDWERRAGRVKEEQGGVREARCRAEHGVPNGGADWAAYLSRPYTGMIDTLGVGVRTRTGMGWPVGVEGIGVKRGERIALGWDASAKQTSWRVAFCVAWGFRRAGSEVSLDVHWISSGIDHDTHINGDKNNAGGEECVAESKDRWYRAERFERKVRPGRSGSGCGESRE